MRNTSEGGDGAGMQSYATTATHARGRAHGCEKPKVYFGPHFMYLILRHFNRIILSAVYLTHIPLTIAVSLH